MVAGRIGVLLSGKEALKRVGLDPGFAKLACRPGSRGEASTL